MKSGGSVVTWGLFHGGRPLDAERLTWGVTAVYSTCCAFAAVKSGGSVVTGQCKLVATQPASNAQHRTSPAMYSDIGAVCSGESGDVVTRGSSCGDELGHGIERSGIGRHSGVLF